MGNKGIEPFAEATPHTLWKEGKFPELYSSPDAPGGIIGHRELSPSIKEVNPFEEVNLILRILWKVFRRNFSPQYPRQALQLAVA